MVDELSLARARRRAAARRHSQGPEVAADHPLSDAALAMALQRLAFEAEASARRHGESNVAVRLWEKAGRIPPLRSAMIRVIVRLSCAPATLESFATGGHFTGRALAGLPHVGPMSREGVLTAVDHWRGKIVAAIGDAGGNFTRAAEILWHDASEDRKFSDSLVTLMCVVARRLVKSEPP